MNERSGEGTVNKYLQSVEDDPLQLFSKCAAESLHEGYAANIAHEFDCSKIYASCF